MEILQDDIVFDMTGKHANVDVVCGMDIIEESVSIAVNFAGARTTFAQVRVKKHFDDYPERYVWDEA